MSIHRLEGLIPLLGGIYCLLMVEGILPRHPKDPEKMALWRRKFRTLMWICGPVTIIMGILMLLGVMDGG